MNIDIVEQLARMDLTERDRFIKDRFLTIFDHFLKLF